MTIRFALVRRSRREPIDRTLTTLGRAPDCDLRFDDENVSGCHALIVAGPDSVRLIDFKSIFGVKVNSRPVTSHELADGDRIEIGSETLTFVLDPTGPRAARPDSVPKNPGDSGPPPAPVRSPPVVKDSSPWTQIGMGLVEMHDAPTREALFERCGRLVAVAVPAASLVGVAVLDSSGRLHESSRFLERHGGQLLAAPLPPLVHVTSAVAITREEGEPLFFADALCDRRLSLRVKGLVTQNVRSILTAPLPWTEPSSAVLVAVVRIGDPLLSEESLLPRLAVIAAHAAHRLPELGR